MATAAERPRQAEPACRIGEAMAPARLDAVLVVTLTDAARGEHLERPTRAPRVIGRRAVARQERPIQRAAVGAGRRGLILDIVVELPTLGENGIERHLLA